MAQILEVDMALTGWTLTEWALIGWTVSREDIDLRALLFVIDVTVNGISFASQSIVVGAMSSLKEPLFMMNVMDCSSGIELRRILALGWNGGDIVMSSSSSCS